jgi:hypothetical protein
MNDSSTPWQGQLLNQLQGPSSLGMALSSSAVGFSASIIDPKVYVGFWTSLAFQMHAGFQLLAIAFGVLFAIFRLKYYRSGQDFAHSTESGISQAEIGASVGSSDRAGRLTKAAIYAQLYLFFAGAVSFVWLMFLYFNRALYPSN